MRYVFQKFQKLHPSLTFGLIPGIHFAVITIICSIAVGLLDASGLFNLLGQRVYSSVDDWVTKTIGTSVAFLCGITFVLARLHHQCSHYQQKSEQIQHPLNENHDDYPPYRLN